MYKEIAKRQSLKSPQFLLGMFASFLVLFLFNFLAQMVQAKTGYIDLLTIGFLVIVTYRLMQSHLISYKYMLIGDEFIIQQILGSKEKIILNIHVNQINKICPVISKTYSEDKLGRYKLKMKLCNTWEKANVFYGIYEEDEESYFFTFQPSDKMIELLRKKICNK